MRFSNKQAARLVLARIFQIILAIPLGFTLLTSAASAQTEVNFSPAPLIVGNDMGGRLDVRLRELARLRQISRPVRITGDVCYSTCTMFISLPNSCVSPTTTFGFHGPSTFGLPLDQATFNGASRIIADHYPPALRDWYMETGRHRINSLYRISGATLIDLGVREC